jgi:cell wall-associated NlpC family hydrolase
VRWRSLVFLGVLAATAPVSVALAAGPGGPIFVRVSTGPRAAPLSIASAIRRQLAAAEHARANVNRREHQLELELRRLRAKLARATDPFAYEDAVARGTNAVARLQARASAWSRLIRRLHAALQPVVLPQPTAPGGTATGWDAVAVAEHYLGVRYLWGGSNPTSGFDCSGFVKFVYAQLGVDLPHYAATQYATTPHVQASQLEAGDLLFFEPHRDGPGHVGMYIGDGVLIEAPRTGDVVKLAPVASLTDALGFVGASRPAALVDARR